MGHILTVQAKDQTWYNFECSKLLNCVIGDLMVIKLASTQAHFESNYTSYYSNYSSIRTSIVATIVLLEMNGGSEHLYSSRLSGSLLYSYLTRWVRIYFLKYIILRLLTDRQ